LIIWSKAPSLADPRQCVVTTFVRI
jgi:hypothetical protein